MSNEVQFDFEKEERPEYNRSDSKLVKIVVKLSGGRVDETQANYVLLGFAILVFATSLFLFLGGGDNNVPPKSDAIPFAI